MDLWYYGLLLLVLHISSAHSSGPEAFFNGNSTLFLSTRLSPIGHTSFSFRACSAGELVSQEGSLGDSISFSLSPTNGSLLLRWKVQLHENGVSLGQGLLDNQWHVVDLQFKMGNLTLQLDDNPPQLVASRTLNNNLFMVNLHSPGSVSPHLRVGRGLVGCILQGPGVTFTAPVIQNAGVQWGPCPIPRAPSCEGYPQNPCFGNPCQERGICIPQDSQNFACRCNSRYYGKTCNFDAGPLCSRVLPCSNQGTCLELPGGNSTKCLCSPQFTGARCEVALPPHSYCRNNPCLNGGACNLRPSGGGYICNCPNGFTGRHCEVNIDECASSPCLNNAVCTDQVNGFLCNCSGTGYQGSRCQENINECQLPNPPCSPDSVCYDRYGGYVCQCPPGLSGRHCGQRLDECSSRPCQNNGTCVTRSNFSYRCICQTGFIGTDCEVNVDDCIGISCPPNSRCQDAVDSYQCVCQDGFSGQPLDCVPANNCHLAPCLHGGTCLQGSSCICPLGFSGPRCEHPSNTCLSNPCQHGQCTDLGTHFKCGCDPGYTGQMCETIIDMCQVNPCQNGGSCVGQVNDYLCHCELGWVGKNCQEDFDECSTNPCVHGRCINLSNNFSCVCNPGYSGVRCETDVDDCQSGPCQNGGICRDQLEGFVCECPPQWMGPTCAEQYNACVGSPCRNGGSCLTSPPSLNFECRCVKGFEGSRCETNIDDCRGVICPPYQICVDLVDNYDCRCPVGLKGVNCSEKFDPCESSPCANGTCVSGPGNYTCHCPPGITGASCELDIDECADNPCQKGICMNLVGSYLCYCQPGFTGRNCHMEFNECLSHPCQNGASCIDRVNNFECLCMPGFDGQHCERNIDECASNPCQHGATCIDGINLYTCQCPPGFTGLNCEIDINECEGDPCLNAGSCVDLQNGFWCDCNNTGFTGVTCDININDCEGSPCQNGGTCMDHVKNYSCQCHPGYEGQNCEVDVPECQPNPCKNRGICLERSNTTLYGMEYLGLFSHFSYETAAGFVCICDTGFTGDLCEINIDDCVHHACVNGTCVDGINKYECSCFLGYEGQNCSEEIDECQRLKPCKNKAICTDLVNDYKCECPSNFGGKNCNIKLIACDNHQCQNGATCKAYYTENNGHEYSCQCAIGFHGEKCDVSTTISFKGKGIWEPILTLNSSTHFLDLGFRTTLPTGLIAYGLNSYNLLAYALSLEDGKLNLNLYGDDHNLLLTLTTEFRLNDGLWKQVGLQIKENAVTLRAAQENIEEPLTTGFFRMKSIKLGGSSGGLPGFQDFVGCIQEVRVNGDLMIPSQGSSTNSLVGCPRNEQCLPLTCLNGGVCQDLWTYHTCACSRPYFGESCELSFVPATFGYLNSVSWAMVDLNRSRPSNLSRALDLSFFLKTRKGSGLVFLLGQDLQDNSQSFTSLASSLQMGLLKLELRSAQEPIVLTSSKRLDDGAFHIVKVVRTNAVLTLQVDEDKMEEVPIPDKPLLSEVLYIGGLPPGLSHASRFKRQANIDNFKGVIQDFRINDKAIEFFPLQLPFSAITPGIPSSLPAQNSPEVLRGIVSDGPCNGTNPCKNGGVCIDIYNDFSCNCTSDFRGPTCELAQPCTTKPCPGSSECRNLRDGQYECIAAMSFRKEEDPLSYDIMKEFKFQEITLRFRSIDQGTLFHSTNLEVLLNPRDITLYVNGRTAVVPLENSGKWMVLRLTTNPPQVTLTSDNHTWNTQVNLQGITYITLPVSSIVEVGAAPFRGCIEEIRLDQHLLPFVVPSYFPLTSILELGRVREGRELGCQICWDEDCRSEGTCQDPQESYNCTCPPSRVGRFCDMDICSTQPCRNNATCDSSTGLLNCICRPGFSGQLCETEIKYCPSNPCRHGSTCVDEIGDYSCLCRQYFSGRNCENYTRRDCLGNPCLNNGMCLEYEEDYQCKCTELWSGKHCEVPVNPCKNGGKPQLIFPDKFVCECPSDFTGDDCSLVVDKCNPNPCQNNGRCRGGECGCLPGWWGQYCTKKFENCTDLLGGVCGNGTCTNNDIGKGYKCTCYPGFVGDHCHLQDPCLNQDCSGQGTCTLTEVGSDYARFKCACNPDYEGENCEKMSISQDNTLTIVLPAVLVVLVTILAVGALLFLRTAKKKRATRGTYSPSRQEMFGSRVEMNQVMKPPPEERLI